MLVASLLVAAKYFPALDQGYASCPCVDPYPLSGPGTGFANCSGILRDGACYPSGYGARGCRAYDNSEFVGGDAAILQIAVSGVSFLLTLLWLCLQIAIAGRVMNYRKSSAKLIFLDLVGDGEKAQVLPHHGDVAVLGSVC